MNKKELFTMEYSAPCVEIETSVLDAILCASDGTGMDDVNYDDYGTL